MQVMSVDKNLFETDFKSKAPGSCCRRVQILKALQLVMLVGTILCSLQRGALRILIVISLPTNAAMPQKDPTDQLQRSVSKGCFATTSPEVPSTIAMLELENLTSLGPNDASNSLLMRDVARNSHVFRFGANQRRSLTAFPSGKNGGFV